MATQTPVFKIEVKGTKDVIRLQEELRKAKAAAKATTDKTEFDRLAAEIVKLTGQLKSARREQTAAVNAFIATDKGTGAYKRLSAQLNASKKQLKDLAAAGKSNTEEFKQLYQNTVRLDKQLKKIDASLGDFGRNVGNYAGSLKGLFGQLRATVRQTQLLRSAPNLFYTLTDAVDVLNNALDLYNETFDDSYVISKRVAEATESLTSEYIKEQAQLDGLAAVATNENETKERRKMAVDALQAQYPDYFANLDRENINIQDVAEGYKKANEELIKNLKAKIRAQIIEKQLQDAVEKRLEASAKAQQAEAQALLQANDVQGFILKNIANVQAQQADISAKTAKTAASNIEQVDASLEDVFATLKDVVQDASLAFDDSDKNLKSLASSTAKTQKKLNNELQKEAERAAAKRQQTLKNLEKEQANFLNDAATKQIDLTKEIQQAAIDLIEDEGKKAQAQEIFNFEQRSKARKQQYEKLVKESEELEKQIAEAAGADSPEAKAFAKKAAAERLALKKQFDELAEAEEALHQQRLQDIAEKGADEARQKELQQAAEKQQALEVQYQIAEEKLKQNFANSLISEAEYQSQSLEQQKAFLEEKQQLLQQQIDAGLFDDEAGKQQLLLQQAQVNTELAQLQEQQTAKTAEESQKRKEKLLQDIETGLNAAKEVFGAISGILIAQQEAEAARFDAQIELRNANIEELQAQLEDAAGLEKAFLEAQINEEIKATEELEEKKAAAEKKAAKTKKATSIIEAIINTALGVTAALSLPFPLNLIQVATVGAVGGAQIATIAAQPLAAGGYTGAGIGKADKTGHKPAGIVHAGEWVAPAWMVKSPKFSSTISGLESSRKTRGFAVGGFTSPQISAPSIQRIATAGSEKENEMLQALDRKTDAINARFDRQQVIFTTETQAAIDKDKKEVREIKTLNKL